jgi:hypothetical protein
MRLQAARNNFIKNNNDLAQNKSNKADNSKSVTVKKLSEYDEQICFSLHKLILNQPMCGLHSSQKQATPSRRFPEQPPDFFIV